MESTDVYALVGEERAEEIREALEHHGLHHDQIEVHPPAPGRYRLHDETLRDDGTAARGGLALGLAVGAVVGLLVALLIPAVSSWTEVVLTAATVAGLGALVGAMARLQQAEHHDGDPTVYRDVAADEHVQLIEVHSAHWAARARRLLKRADVTFLDGPNPV